MTNDSTATATVETLTAEVRVLMVGNRQITQSIAKQLDRVKLDQLDMFGRVRLGGDMFVIGRRIDGGDLVIADPDTFRGPDRFVAVLSYNGPDSERPTIENPNRTVIGKYTRVSLGETPCEIRSEDLAYDSSVFDPYFEELSQWEARKHTYAMANSCSTYDFPEPRPTVPTYTWNPGRHEGEFRRQIAAQRAEFCRRRALYVKARALPLIVLAGLR